MASLVVHTPTACHIATESRAWFMGPALNYHGVMQVSDPPAEPLRSVTISVAPMRPAAERYDIGEPIGRGGMATVYAASDRALGRQLALKRLTAHPEAPKQRRNAELFEKEYLALAQLSHPGIVAVYDYGIDLDGAYYTMERVDGADLQQLSPLPWRQACALARDVCSALAFLHSRRLVHRDVSPRNVRVTGTGRVKLLDFGALAPFGASKLVVGTPPCCAPEVVQLQSLDGRADLYALGAVLYYALVGHHAYGARSFGMLTELWQTTIEPPSRHHAEIPAALDSLVLDLLRLDPDARPGSAAEVLQRLSAIDGERADDEHAALAYLATPPLVGREEALARARRKLKRAAHGHAQALVVEGKAGVGRSRFLGACSLDATLLGVCVARADADDALAGEYGTIRALLRQLVAALPHQTATASQAHYECLARAFPELRTSADAALESAPFPERHRLQAALRDWFGTLCESHTLLIVVDDFQGIDEPSAALLSLLATQTKHALCLIVALVAIPGAVPSPAQKLLLETASRLTLEDLKAQHTEALFKSLFGDVPYVEGLARRVQQITSGNPRDVLRLAEHLVDSGTVRYEAGAWTLPARIDQVELPGSMEQAMRARIAGLRLCAVELATGLALRPDRVFSLEECAVVQEYADVPSLRRDLSGLVQAGIVRTVDESFGLSSPDWAKLLSPGVEPSVNERLHARLASVLEGRGEALRAAQHWFRARQPQRGLDVLVEHARVSQEQTARDNTVFVRYARALPADWLDIFDEAIGLCEPLGRPRRDAFILRGRLAGIVPAFAIHDRGHTDVLIEQLRKDSGLADFAALDTSLAPAARVKLALQQASVRYAATDEQARVFEPKHAMTVLIRTTSTTVSQIRYSLDVTVLRTMPPMAALAPIAPAFGVFARLCEGMDARFSGRIERALELYAGLVDELSSPDHGLDPSYAQGMNAAVMCAFGLLEACMGKDSCLRWAERIEAQPARRSDAVQIRALYHLFQGNARACDECKKQLELLRVETVQLYEGSSLAFEIVAHSMADDMTRMRRVVEELEPLASKYPAWRAVAHFGAAEYQRMRQAPERATADIERALDLARPGVHPLWANIASAHVRLVARRDSPQAALALARDYVATASDAQLNYTAECLQAELAICQALTRQAEAAATADALIERMRSRGMNGLQLGFAHETRAQVALIQDDRDMFDVQMRACEQIYLAHKSAALRAKCERLRRLATPPVVSASRVALVEAETTLTGTRLIAALESCKAEQRGRLALTLLAAYSGSSAGFLFTLEQGEVQCTAAIGDRQLPSGLAQRVVDYLDVQHEHDDTTATDSEEYVDVEWRDAEGRRYRPVLLSHDVQGSLCVVGAAVLEIGDGCTFKYPAETASAVSRFWSEFANSRLLLSND